MYQALSNKLVAAFDKIKGRGVLTAEDVNLVMREIRISLLEADVALSVVKDFIENCKTKALGQLNIQNVNPSEQIIKIVHDELVSALGSEVVPINLSSPSPFAFMMIGLQGSGKTTSSAKLALHLTKQYQKKVLLVSLDIYRPAAQLQLQQLAQANQLNCLEIEPSQQPLQIALRAQTFAKQNNIDVIIFDTAGRLHIDETLMAELKQLEHQLNPLETLLVVDSMTGQDAANIAHSFREAIKLTGIVLSRADGDSRGGAALSMRTITGCPIKFLGVGEKATDWQIFDAQRIANKILQQGDVVEFVEKMQAIAQDVDQEKMVKRMEKGLFDLNDLASQLKSVNKMGGISSLLGLIPGLSGLMGKLESSGMDKTIIKKQLAIIGSMTKKERRYPDLLNASRKLRISKGSGVAVMEINRLLKFFEQSKKMMKRFKGGNLNFNPSMLNKFKR